MEWVDVLDFGGSELKLGVFKSKKEDSSGSEDDESNTRRYESMAASRLLKRTKSESRPSSKRTKISTTGNESPPLSLSSSPSPLPPPAKLLDDKTTKLLNKADAILNRLLNGDPPVPDIDDLPPCTPPSVRDIITLRVRCRGKIYKYKVNKYDPFSNVIVLLGEELSVSGSKKILLSHKTSTITPTDSPGSLGLTTASIIDAAVIIESLSLSDSQTSSSGARSDITIKVQTSDRSMMYSLAKDDPLQKVMTAFACELKLSVSRLKFCFDGKTISPSQTARDLEMESEDCIDVSDIHQTISLQSSKSVTADLHTDQSIATKSISPPTPNLNGEVTHDVMSPTCKQSKKSCYSQVSAKQDSLSMPTGRDQVGYAQLVLGAPYEAICSSAKIARYRKSLNKNFEVVTVCSSDIGPAIGSACFRIDQSHVVLIKIVEGKLNTEKMDAVVIPTDRADCAGRYPVEMASLKNTFRYLYNSGELAEIGDTATLDGGSLSCSYIIQALLPLSVPDNFSCDIVVKNCLAHASKMQLGSIAFPGIRTQMVQSLVDGLSSMVSTTLHTVCIVLDNHAEADGFARALNDLVSCSNPKAKQVMFDSASVGKQPASEFVWSWRDDNGIFKPYSQANNKELNQAYRTDPNIICALNINGTLYGINFKVMRQINLMSGHEREVTNHLSRGVTWKYLGDHGHFICYSPTDSVQIETMFQAKDTSQLLVILNRRYKFDFAGMKQVNMETGYKRDIKRELSGGDDEVKSKAATTTTHKRPEFLCHNEVVVNLKGPSKNIQTAKTHLFEKLKSLLFSRVISYPPKATPVLLSKLKGVAKKHSVTLTFENSSGASIVGEHIKLEGLENSVVKALTEIQGLIINFQFSLEQLPKSADETSPCPPEWDHMSKEEQLKIVDLTAHSPEYRAVCSKFQETLSNQLIVRVQRVQNKWLWDRYVQTKCRLHKKNAGMINEKELFHGTRDNPAKIICASEEGFDMRFSRQGMWGQANYFAVKASYSDSYSYHDRCNQTSEMILAKVLTGDSYSCGPDSSLRMPPEKKQSSLASGAGQIQQVRYDSVTGHTNGSQVFMTYNNDRAYPAYIITYSSIGGSGGGGFSIPIPPPPSLSSPPPPPPPPSQGNFCAIS